MIITVLIIGILIGLSITVKAVNIISSNDVEYNDTNVKKAIDDLYTLASDNGSNKKIYGVRRSLTSSSSSWERVADSVGLEANAQIGSDPVKNDFDNIYPWSEIKYYRYDTGTKSITSWYGESNYDLILKENEEILIYIPEFYYIRFQQNGYEYILISSESLDIFSKSEAFSVGKYLSTTDGARVHSRDDTLPLASGTITDLRTQAQNLGEEFGVMDYHYFIIELLYLVEYADYNSQKILGSGLAYRGMENAGYSEFIDGINIQNNQVYINYNSKTYQIDKFDGDYKKIGYINASSAGYVSKLGYDAENPLIAFPTEVSGTESTYITDYYTFKTGNCVPYISHANLSPDKAGMFNFSITRSSSAYSNVGFRLIRYHQ